MDDLAGFDYVLPEERIAQTPLADRAASRLLWVHRLTGEIQHRYFRDVVDILHPGDLLVMNDTRVTAMRLFGRRPTGGAVELLLLKDRGEGRFEALTKPAKKLAKGSAVQFENGLEATIMSEGEAGLREIVFTPEADLMRRLAEIALAPLPPYIREPLKDRERYQTVYAATGGSAAAPTAGLHFTPELLAALTAKGVQTATVTLDVGLDTFRPIQAESISEHEMHGERCRISTETSQAIASCKGRIIAVGTTATRTLETMAEGLRHVRVGETTSKLFITPGYKFQIIDGMFTNFHMPKTTMLLMLGAFAGLKTIAAAYESALVEKYRFLSFGDSMLLL